MASPSLSGRPPGPDTGPRSFSLGGGEHTRPGRGSPLAAESGDAAASPVVRAGLGKGGGRGDAVAVVWEVLVTSACPGRRPGGPRPRHAGRALRASCAGAAPAPPRRGPAARR